MSVAEITTSAAQKTAAASDLTESPHATTHAAVRRAVESSTAG